MSVSWEHFLLMEAVRTVLVATKLAKHTLPLRDILIAVLAIRTSMQHALGIGCEEDRVIDVKPTHNSTAYVDLVLLLH